MISVRFEYYDGTVIDCQKVESLKRIGFTKDYTGDEILTSFCPINENYWVKSSNASYSVCCNNLKAISIYKD